MQALLSTPREGLWNTFECPYGRVYNLDSILATQFGTGPPSSICLIWYKYLENLNRMPRPHHPLSYNRVLSRAEPREPELEESSAKGQANVINGVGPQPLCAPGAANESWEAGGGADFRVGFPVVMGPFSRIQQQKCEEWFFKSISVLLYGYIHYVPLS